MEKFYVYIIYSEKTNKFYTGYCSNIIERVEKHNNGSTPSTKPGIPWKLVYEECFDSKTDAIKRENEIKRKKSRKYIEFLISSQTDSSDG